MRTIFDDLAANWSIYVIPIAVFTVSIIALFWLRRWMLARLTGWTGKIKWPEDNFLIQAVKGPSALLSLILSIYLGLAVSSIPADWKDISGKSLWTLFVIAMTLTLLSLARSISVYYGHKFKLPNHAVLVSRNVMRIVILAVAALMVMDIWGLPTSPVLLLIAVIIMIAILAFRDSVPDFAASFQIAATQEFKVGDYIKLDSNEEGYITNISWNRTAVQGLDGATILIPNEVLVRRKTINYGRPLKRAKASFHFNTRTHLAELTGLKAHNLAELAATLKTAPDPIVYYHTHHYLEEHQYLVPELSNDFAGWVKTALGDEVLGERLANISAFEFNSSAGFRDKLVNVMETYLAQEPRSRDVPAGREFYFMKSVDVLLPTAYSAHDLREFVEALRKISVSSLYFHVFESRFRLKNGLNDFAVWLAGDMEEKELSQEIAKIDPYTYTLEGLRSLLIQTIEKHIK